MRKRPHPLKDPSGELLRWATPTEIKPEGCAKSAILWTTSDSSRKCVASRQFQTSLHNGGLLQYHIRGRRVTWRGAAPLSDLHRAPRGAPHESIPPLVKNVTTTRHQNAIIRPRVCHVCRHMIINDALRMNERSLIMNDGGKALEWIGKCSLCMYICGCTGWVCSISVYDWWKYCSVWATSGMANESMTLKNMYTISIFFYLLIRLVPVDITTVGFGKEW